MSGIYIHIPFCRRACTYCNFHFSTSLKLKDQYIDALIREIQLPQSFIDTDEPVRSVYLGGGTPSLLQAGELEKVFDALHSSFTIDGNAEITLEANPDDITTEALKTWLSTGINRLSLGIQSFNDAELQWMNRTHTAAQSLNSIELIREAGFNNFSVDLIYGSPLLTNMQFEKTLDLVFQKNIPHISCYALTVEPKTALNSMIVQKKIQPVNTDIQAEQFILMMQKMKANHYEHYEISNFSLPGNRSMHNSSYWQGRPYFGFGASAHAFDGNNKRRWNISNNSLYINALEKGLTPYTEEVLTITQQLNETIMIALRTTEGLDLTIIESRFGTDAVTQLVKGSRPFVHDGKLLAANERLVLTDKGKLFADGIAAELFF